MVGNVSRPFLARNPPPTSKLALKRWLVTPAFGSGRITRHSEKADAERPERDQERETRRGPGIYWAHFAAAIHLRE